MECNRDEAARAKEIAEKKFGEKNYAVAKKFVLKAQNLYPGLEGLSQMLTTLDVYISADNKIGGESDWYGVLGVNSLDDDETIRKQYRKLALMLHPDKNKAIGAEGAFKLVSEAWGLLSDKAKRLAYNHKRNSKGFQQNVPTQTGGPSAGTTANGYQNFRKNVTSNVRTQSNARASFTSAPSVKKTDTFWTICNRCKTHYEYLRMYLNHTLLCPNCHEAFMALERDPPPNVFKQSNWSSRQSHSSTGHTSASSNAFNSQKNSTGANSFNKTNFQWGPFSQTGDHTTGATSSAAAQAASVVQQASEKVKRQREERQSAAEWERSHLFNEMANHSTQVDRPSKKRNIEDNHLNGYSGYMVNGMAMGNGGFGTRGLHEVGKGNSQTHRIFGVSNTYIKPNSVRELSYPEIRNMLMHKAKTKISRVLQEWRSSSAVGMANKENVNKKQKGVAKREKENVRHSKSSVINEKSVAGNSANETNKEGTEISVVTISVPDSDFHNFDLDRAENSFKEEQVWAAYDDDDGMPRFYARIHKVISLNPFRVRISWLNSRSNSELGPIDWIGRGFAKTCGDFRVGKHESCGTINSFSHEVSWEKGSRGVFRIYPKKGEVWALYKNWSPEWHEQTPDEEIHKYEMVEVLENFDEEQGVSVAPLIKVPGYRTVFRTHLDDPKEVRKIPRGELFRFSHQVPYYLLTGEEADNAPKGCLELDPAATPLELIQATMEAGKAPPVENGGKGKAAEEIPQSAPNAKAAKPMEIASKAEKEER